MPALNILIAILIVKADFPTPDFAPIVISSLGAMPLVHLSIMLIPVLTLFIFLPVLSSSNISPKLEANVLSSSEVFKRSVARSNLSKHVFISFLLF